MDSTRRVEERWKKRITAVYTRFPLLLFFTIIIVDLASGYPIPICGLHWNLLYKLHVVKLLTWTGANDTINDMIHLCCYQICRWTLGWYLGVDDRILPGL